MKILSYVASNWQPVLIDTSGDFNRIRIRNANPNQGVVDLSNSDEFNSFYSIEKEFDLPLIAGEPLYARGYNAYFQVILYKENVGGSSCTGFTGTIDLTAK